jgi:predicted DNA-binding protein (MmcQ/YjbR family)
MNGQYIMNREHYNSLLKEFKTKDAILKYVNESYNLCYLIVEIIVGD